jgi:hypothetical protein
MSTSTRAHLAGMHEYQTFARTQLWRRIWTSAAENSDETDQESMSEYDGAAPDVGDVESEFGDAGEEKDFQYSTRAEKPSNTFEVSAMADFSDRVVLYTHSVFP